MVHLAYTFHFLYGILFISAVISIDLTIERPQVMYFNNKYIKYVNISATRQRRGGPYFLNIYGTIQQPWGKNVTVDLLFLELLSNEYKPSFIHLRSNLCDLVKNDKWAGQALYNAGLKDKSCPYAQGDYALVNMQVPTANIPTHFPFRNGKVNVTLTQNEKNETIGMGVGYITVHEQIKNKKKISKA